METKCNKSEINEHCWHTGSGMDSASYGNLGGKSITHYMCCWCGETKTEELDWNTTNPIPHGPHKWFKWNDWAIPVPPSTTQSPWPTEVCLIEEFFKKNPDATSCLIYCPCSRHGIICR